MNKNCEVCKKDFAITDLEKKFLERIGVQDSLACPTCRQIQRLSFRNERTLYKRRCNLCGQNIISIYSPDKKYLIYCQDCFWSDKWSALDFGLDYDPKEPFFDQFKKLMEKVPRLSIINKQSQNSDYCNYSFANKNCYLTFGNHYEEDCIYGHYSTQNKNCVDYLWLYKSELCYECSFCKNCYNSVYLDHSENCNDCYFSIDLKGCKNCIGCTNLREKQYYIFNKPHTKEEYENKLKELNLGTLDGFTKTQEFFSTEFRKLFPFRNVYQTNCEDCDGNNLENCRNLAECFDCTACEDCGFGFQMDETYDSMDMNCMGYDRSEVCYQTIGCSGIFNCIACDSCWHDNDLQYCQLCFSAKDSFGCVSLNQKQYCILNKQYSKEEYLKIKEKIIDSLKKEGRYGQFFPVEMSAFGYNETVAQERFAIGKSEISERGFKWHDEDKKDFMPQTYKGSYDIEEVGKDILKTILACKACGKNYKIIEPEFDFYKKLEVRVPDKCPDCRHKERVSHRNPTGFFDGKCGKCGAEIKTSYKPGGPEKVFCESCYLKEVY